MMNGSNDNNESFSLRDNHRDPCPRDKYIRFTYVWRHLMCLISHRWHRWSLSLHLHAGVRWTMRADWRVMLQMATGWVHVRWQAILLHVMRWRHRWPIHWHLRHWWRQVVLTLWRPDYRLLWLPLRLLLLARAVWSICWRRHCLLQHVECGISCI